MVHEKYVVTTRRRRNFARCRPPPRVLFTIAAASLTAAGLNSEIVAEKEKKKEEDGEKKAKATHAGWNNNHAEMKLHFGKLSAVCHLLTEATKRHFPTCSAPALEPQPLCAASPQLTGGSLRWEKAIIHRLPKSKVLLTPFIYYQQPLTLGCAFSTSGFREKGPGRESHVLEVMSS